MSEEVTIYINDKPQKIKLPPELKDSKIYEENGKLYVNYGIYDYINKIQFELEQKQEEIDGLNNIINELEKSWKEQQEYYRYRKDNRYRTFLSKNLDKLKKLKENKEYK